MATRAITLRRLTQGTKRPIDPRMSRSRRGYDRAWMRLRRNYLAKQPLCHDCRAKGRTTAAEEVHHIRGFRGTKDPQRLDVTNLMALCKPCHSRRTAMEMRTE